MNARRQNVVPETGRAPICWKLPMAIRELRQALGITQEVLAGTSGVSLRMVRYIETRERVPSIEFVEWLAVGLGLSFAELGFIAERLGRWAE